MNSKEKKEFLDRIWTFFMDRENRINLGMTETQAILSYYKIEKIIKSLEK